MRNPDPDWLTRESEQWESAGIISAEQRQAILVRYPAEADDQLSSRALIWLAWLVGGFGLILLVAWNWTGIPGPVKVAGTQILTAVLYVAAWRASKAGASRRTQRLVEWLAFAGALAVGAVMAAVTDEYALNMAEGWPLFAWAAAIALTAVVVASPITTALGTCVLAFWAMTQTGDPPAPWAFLAVFPLLALAIERRPNIYAAGLLTLAFGTWVTLVGLDTWPSPFVPGITLLASGAALDTWAHSTPRRRPAFASSTPALALVVVGLWFLGMGGLNTAPVTQVWRDAAVSLPGLVLLLSLIAVSLWPSAAQRAAHWRPLVFGVLAICWLSSTAIVAGGDPGNMRISAPAWFSWMWTILASLALVFTTISTVGEGVATRNRALFVVGVAAMVALVTMHLGNDNADLGQSASVLFLAAGVLWWVSRTLRHKPV